MEFIARFLGEAMTIFLLASLKCGMHLNLFLPGANFDISTNALHKTQKRFPVASSIWSKAMLGATTICSCLMVLMHNVIYFEELKMIGITQQQHWRGLKKK